MAAAAILPGVQNLRLSSVALSGRWAFLPNFHFLVLYLGKHVTKPGGTQQPPA